MKLTEMLKELEEKPFFREFKKENPKSFLCAGFFIFDKENNKNQHQLDFFNPSKNQIISFEHPFENLKIHEDKIESQEKLELKNVLLDIEDLKEITEELVKKNEIKSKTNKIIAVLSQRIWNITCIQSDLSILRIKINAETKEQIVFEKQSLLDFVKVCKK